MEETVPVSELQEIKTEIKKVKDLVCVVRDTLLGKLENGKPGLIQRMDNLTMQTRWQWLAIGAIMLGLLGVFLGKR